MENNDLLTGSKACELLGVRRSKLPILIEKSILHPVFIEEKKKNYFYDEEIKQLLLDREKYPELIKKDSIIAPNNHLNDLTGSQWLPETKSFFYQKGLGKNSKEAEIEKMHPAPFSFQDIDKLITFFTKKGMIVLDPFGGVGSTAKACEINDRNCISIELSPQWHELAKERLETEVGKGTSEKHTFINADSTEFLKTMETDSVDFVITSPPYWNILNKKNDHKTKLRVEKNLATNYSQNSHDLGNIVSYEQFLNILVDNVFMECARVLKKDKYMCLIVSDFRNKSEYISFHSDIIEMMKNRSIDEKSIVQLHGIKILLQNHKTLLPYGYPFAFVENIHHQYILIFRKVSKTKNELSEI